MNKKFGLYIHIPFCAGKCPYCDFFSINAEQSKIDEYTNELIKSVKYWGNHTDREVTSVYFGGGTPNLLGSVNLNKVLSAVFGSFKVSEKAEITTELNPGSITADDIKTLRSAGFNRLSFGLQSANINELKILGRRHSAEQVKKVINLAQKSGFENISLDLMLGIPNQTKESLSKSINFCVDCGVTHISAYILKIEENTPFYKNKDTLDIPDEDTQAEFYAYAVEQLEKCGYAQYEISNFSKPGYESRHNLTYWECEEYIGVGPAAHSFFEGKRFFYPRSFNDFYNNSFIPDGEGGSIEEYVMLNLRLNKGIIYNNFKEKYGIDFPEEIRFNAKKFEKLGLLTSDSKGIRLNSKGFLVSNAIISELIY